MTTVDQLASPAAGTRVSFTRAVRSEWIKLLTLRSTWWSVGLVMLISIGLSALVAITLANSPVDQVGPDGQSFPSGVVPILAIVQPVQFTQLLGGILGVMAVTGEYSTGMIRSTLAAVPNRRWVLLSKAFAVATLVFAVSVIGFVFSMVVVTMVLAPVGLTIDFAAPAQSLLPVLYAALLVAAYSLLGVGVGFLVRSGAAAISIVVGLVFVLPVVISVVLELVGDGANWLTSAANYLPSMLGQAAVLPPGISSGTNGPEGVWALLVMLAWPAAALLGGYLVLSRRDA